MMPGGVDTTCRLAQRDANGAVTYRACFAAGTLVHTEQGLLPIEQVRVGTRVLSKPEHSVEPGKHDQAYRNVINTVATLDQRVHAVQVKVEGGERLTTLFPTPNHPFWVEDVVVDGEHWLATEFLEQGMVLQLADGRKATVHANGLIRRTQNEVVGFAADDKSGIGIVLDLSDRCIAVASDALAAHLMRSGQTLKLGEPYVVPVYNFEVEELHTYYVGESAVWVHNVNCVADPVAAIDAHITRQQAIERINQRDPCFVAGTLVRTKDGMKPIEEICVGDWVLTYPDDQIPPKRAKREDEYFYRQVTKTFVTDDQLVSYIEVTDFGDLDCIGVTPNHPIYEGHPGFAPFGCIPGEEPRGDGWRPASQIKFGSTLVKHSFGNAVVGKVKHEVERARVYNLEVDEFHTYFVGKIGIWVHNKGNVPEIMRSLKELETKQRLYERVGWVEQRETQHCRV